MFKLSVIIPAAGSGVRMGGEIPKPLIQVGGKPVLVHTIFRFLKVSQVIQIIVATSQDYMEKMQEVLDGINTSDVEIKVVLGGSERQYSINNALQQVADEADLVAVHDAVRPFIRPELIIQCCEKAKELDGAIIGVPAKDTIKKVNKNRIIESTPDRSQLWQAQTPQVFQKKILLKAYEAALKDGFVGTDDASLVERIGGQIQMVEGDRENLKITYPVDLEIAKLILDNNQ